MSRGTVTGIAVATVVIVASAAAAGADEIWVGKLPYSGVKVIGCRDGEITFEMAGRRITKPLTEVTKIVLADAPVLTSAEELFAACKYAQAVKRYQQYLRSDSKSWKASLALHRKTQAESTPVGKPPRPKRPARPASAPAAAKTCPFCHDSGWGACDRCKAGGFSTGKARCAVCDGTGWMTCPDCHGKWRDRKCPYCGGRGKITSRKHTGIFVHTTSRSCSHCGGTGYCKTCCDDRNHRGTVPCTACGGHGWAGVCPQCAGLKKVPCPHCDKGAALASKLSAEKAAGKGTPELDELLAKAPEEVETYGMTSLQAELARAEHRKKGRQSLRTLVGREVTWTVEVLDVVRGDAPPSDLSGWQDAGLFADGTITVVARSDSGFPIFVTYPEDRAGELGAFRMGQFATVSGKVAGCADLPTGLLETTPSLEITGSTIKEAPHDKGPLWVSGGAAEAVYLIDGRVAASYRFAEIRRAVINSISALEASQQFTAQWWGLEHLQTIARGKASEAQRQPALEKLAQCRPTGADRSRDFRKDLQRYVGGRATSCQRATRAVYLLIGSDLRDPKHILETARRDPWDKTSQVNVIVFGRITPATEKALEQLAAERGGRFTHVP